MSILVMIIHIITSILIIIAVLLQVGKGASMGSTFGGGGSSALFGSSGPASLLAKITGVCAVIFMLTSLFLTYNGSKVKSASIMSDIAAPKAPAAQPITPSAVPVQSQPAAPAKAEPQKK